MPHAEAEDRLRERLIALGYQEIVAIPLVDTKRDALFRPEGVAPAVIGNPLAEDASVMRSTGIVSMAGALEWNLNHGQRNLRLFEIGKTYELRMASRWKRGADAGRDGPGARENDLRSGARYSFADLKGDLDRIGELAGGFAWQSGGPGWLAGARAAQISLAHGNGIGRVAIWASPASSRGALPMNSSCGRMFSSPNCGSSLCSKRSIESERRRCGFKPLPRFPAVERDFSLVLADGVTFAQVAETIRALQIAELESIEAADLFRGGQFRRENSR